MQYDKLPPEEGVEAPHDYAPAVPVEYHSAPPAVDLPYDSTPGNPDGAAEPLLPPPHYNSAPTLAQREWARSVAARHVAPA